MALLPLNAWQRAGLEDLLAHTPLAKERCRAQARLWVAEGMDVEGIGELLHVSRQTVYNWVGRFRGRRRPTRGPASWTPLDRAAPGRAAARSTTSSPR